LPAHPHFFASLHETDLPNTRRLQALCRKDGIEVLFSVIENMTKDDSDRLFISWSLVGFKTWTAGSRPAEGNCRWRIHRGIRQNRGIQNSIGQLV
jgi:hypothetical protein